MDLLNRVIESINSTVWSRAFALCAVLLAPYIVLCVRRGHKGTTIDFRKPMGRTYFEVSGVPPPNSLIDFDINTAKSRPYRPFRWKYYQTMSLSPMEADWWIELEATYKERIQQRIELFSRHGKRIIDCAPGSEDACTELMYMIIEYLCARYTDLFHFDMETSIFHNHILGTRSHTKTISPLHFILENVPEDFLITLKDQKTGLYHLRAGVSCSAVGWNMAQKMGKPLHAIHEPVPSYKEKMQRSMDRFFENMTSDKPIQRGSWSLEIGQPLFLQPEDPEYALRNVQSDDITIQDIHLRVDWQTLRRLPLSRAIVFNFKALFTPIEHLKDEPYVPRLLSTVLRDSARPFMIYKNVRHVEHKVLPALDDWAKEQEGKSWVPKNWEVRTLDENPFFPGWNRK